MLVRETAVRRLEESRADWAYSRPVVALNVLWNLSFAVASAAVLSTTLRERPNVPARLWLVGYAIQSVVHVALVWMEYRRRRIHVRRNGGGGDASEHGMSVSDGDESGEEEGVVRRGNRLSG